MNVLNLGCGERADHTPGWVNVDIRALHGVDVVHDLNDFPWPFDDEEFDNCNAEDIIEHLDDIVAVMDEIWRVLVPGGQVWIRTCHYQSVNAYSDVTHKHVFSEYAFDYLDPSLPFGEKYDYYTDRKFRIVQAERDGEEMVLLLEKLLS